MSPAYILFPHPKKLPHLHEESKSENELIPEVCT